MTDDADDFLARLAAVTPPLEPIEIEGLGTVYMRRRTGEDQWRLLLLQDEILKRHGRQKIPPAALVATVLVKADGTPQFEDLAAGFQALAKIDSKVLDQLFDHALRVTGLGERALELAEKKSSSSQSSESGTNSPSSSEE